MKKALTVIGILFAAGILAYPAFAYGPGWGRGPTMMGYVATGPGYCWDNGPAYGGPGYAQGNEMAELDRKFYEDTVQLKNNIWEKTAELNSLLSAKDPDTSKVSALQKEISELRAELDQKALSYEMAARKIAPEAGYYGFGCH